AAGLAEALVQHLLDPWTGRVDDRARPDFDSARERRVPSRAIAPRQEAFGAYQDARAALGSIHGVRNHQARVVHAAVGVDEAVLELALQTGAVRRRVEPYRVRSRQERAPGQVIIQKQPQPDRPA